MKNINYFIIILLITTTSSCYKNPPERNKIVFRDKIVSIQDSLVKMKGLLTKLPERDDNLNINYKIKNKKIYVNGKLFDDNFMNGDKLYFSISEKHNFTVLAYYLNKNYISTAYFDEGPKIWRFIYRELLDPTFDDSRNIAVLNNNQAISIQITDTILDRKGRVYLLAPKEAKIR